MTASSKKIGNIFHSSLVSIALLFVLIFFSSGCNRPSSINAPPKPTPATEFERDLEKVRVGQYRYVYVFSRPDNAPFTSDDAAYLKANSPLEVNGWYKTDEGRRVIAGSNFTFKPEQMEALKKRFTMEDYTGR